ncbi:MAG TPA: calcineurin-like phosphoesterase family protein [Chitinophagaceae bacterium]|nr:calcineurin-like phosphoesterase family protein [Chitinophagaceae bacterium]
MDILTVHFAPESISLMQRRNFLKSFGAAGAAVAAPALLTTATSPVLKKNIANLTLRGVIHNNGQGLAGVAVTDGVNIAVSDKNGRYELPSTNDTQFVYISSPRGYQFPVHNGLARFYQPVTGKNGTFRADFHLEKLPIDDRSHNFVVWADPQIKTASDAEQLKTTTVPDLQALVQSYGPDTLFHAIGCGDLVWDRFELFDDYKQAVLDTGVTFFNVIGNHDLDLDARTDEYSSKTFRQHFGPTYYSFNRGDIHYVVLDDVFFIGAGRKYIGYLTERQLQWLEQDLALIPAGSTVILSLHIPTNTGDAQRTHKEEDISNVVSNRKQLYDLLAPFKVHILSGHTHVSQNWEAGTIMEHNHGTVCGAWWTGPICTDGTPNGYAVYEVSGSDLRWYYKATGKPKEHQLRLYARGKAAGFPEQVAANVWNWDCKWTVEWFEDEVPKGAMERRAALDPWAVELFADKEHPKPYKFIAPTLADHLFFATPSPLAKNVTVKATDRFGNVFTETLKLWGGQNFF